MTELLPGIYITVGLAVGIFFLRSIADMFFDERDELGIRMLGWMVVGVLAIIVAVLWPLIAVGRLAMIGVKK